MDTTRISATTLARRLGAAPQGPGGPAYRVLADRIRGAVLDGRLTVATGLPSERELAAGLNLSRTTVGAAYALLRDQGWLDSRRGSGSRLRLPDGAAGTGSWGGGVRGNGSDRNTSHPGGVDRSVPGAESALLGPAGIFGRAPDSGWGDSDVGADGLPAVIDLTTACLPAPADAVAGALTAAAEHLPRYLHRDGYQPFGVQALRDIIAARYRAVGLPTTAEQILVTSGAQHAFTLIVGELSAPGDRVLIECPTYPVALDALRAQRRVPAPVGIGDAAGNDNDDGNGWDVELFAATMRQIAPRLGYLIPDFHNPTGALMDEPTRESIVGAARDSGTLLLADESFRDVPFPGTSPIPPPLAAFEGDSSGTRVLSLGSVSKSIWGGLRVGWIRAAPSLVQRLATARALGDMAGPIIDQLVAAELLADPAAALAVQRARLATGAAALRSALAATLPQWRPSHPRGGTSLWVRLPGPFATELALLAPSVGVRIAPGPRFGPDGTMASYLRLPFTTTPERLVTAVGRLASIAPQAAAGARSTLPGWLT